MKKHNSEYYVNLINAEIVSCQDCQPRDNEEDEGFIWIKGDRKEVFEVLEDYDVPNSMWDDVISQLECPDCGHVFEVDSEIGMMDKYEKAYLSKCKFITNNVNPKINEFSEYLEEYPYLGANHKIGQLIIKEIQSFPLENITNEIYYRSRNVVSGKTFTIKDMGPPPSKKVTIPEGRFNHYGQSHFYLGDSEKLCAWEVINKNECLIWMQKIKMHKISNVLNINQFIQPDNIEKIPTVFTAIINSDHMKKVCDKNSPWKPEYFVSRFIADVAKENNINAIKYSSVKDYGSNLVVFDIKKCDIKFEKKPYIYTLSGKYKKPKWGIDFRF